MISLLSPTFAFEENSSSSLSQKKRTQYMTQTLQPCDVISTIRNQQDEFPVLVKAIFGNSFKNLISPNANVELTRNSAVTSEIGVR